MPDPGHSHNHLRIVKLGCEKSFNSYWGHQMFEVRILRYSVSPQSATLKEMVQWKQTSPLYLLFYNRLTPTLQLQ